ncbi:MAG TPA: response regulator [Pirellulales bacterium]|nr:response regulator [Pirellulales bacterium]
MPRQLLEHLNHELRSPMTVIVGMTDLLLLAPLDPDQKNCLQSVRQASDGLLVLLDELVDFSRLEAGSLHLADAEFSLTEAVEQARVLVDRSPGTKIPLALAIEGEVPPRLTGDCGRLAQIIAGLARSAAKLRSASPLLVRVAAEQAEDARVRLHFALGNAGAEFVAAQAPSDQLGAWITTDSFRRDGYRGAGLSLPIAGALVALMGGRLWIAGDATHPVAFRFSCVCEPASVAAPGDLMAAIEQQLGDTVTGWRVLLAEDTRANQQFFRTVLEQRGHTVVTVANGREAVEAFTSAALDQPFDVVLLDLEMPIMDGRQAATALRQSAAFARRPAALVALTAHSPHAMNDASAAQDFDAMISKPCELEMFFQVIDSAVRGASLPPPDASSKGASSEEIAESVVDYRTALARLGGNTQLLHDLAAFFLEDAPGILSQLSAALAAGDAAGTERAAHSLKGLAANFGARAAVRAAGELQDAARRGALDQAQSLHAALSDEVKKLAEELHTLSANCDPPSNRIC